MIACAGTDDGEVLGDVPNRSFHEALRIEGRSALRFNQFCDGVNIAQGLESSEIHPIRFIFDQQPSSVGLTLVKRRGSIGWAGPKQGNRLGDVEFYIVFHVGKLNHNSYTNCSTIVIIWENFS